MKKAKKKPRIVIESKAAIAREIKRRKAAKKVVGSPDWMGRLEEALPLLRAGKKLRRLAWHPASFIFRLDDRVYIKLPDVVERAPMVWKPYPECLLADDWMVA